jgi:hypothetical protein
MTTLAKKKTIKKLSDEAFKNSQLSLFQSFICNKEEERDQLSNTMDLWDSIPRYSVSRQTMNKLRQAGSFLDTLKIEFNYRGTSLKAIIHPARIENENGEKLDYYPSATEELIEDALRKIATDQHSGYFEKSDYRSGVIFTLYALREELKKRGHTRSYQEIKQSLKILAHSTIELRKGDGDEESFAVSAYFPVLVGVTRKNLEEDYKTKWLVQFHPLVTESIDQLTYRQYNYHQMMNYNTQLARWLHKQLSLKFTFAGIGNKFETRYSTIKRDSALLNGYKQERQAIWMLDAAFDELKTNGIILRIEKHEIRGARNKLEDVVYDLYATIDFIHSTKAANKRITVTKETS